MTIETIENIDSFVVYSNFCEPLPYIISIITFTIWQI